MTTAAAAVPAADPNAAAPAGHDAAMAAKAAAGTGNPAPAAAPARPENIPEKFWDATKGQVNTDALLSSYAELEKKLSTPKPNGKPANQNADPNADNKNAAGLDVEALNKEFTENGKLSDETYTALEKAGLPRDAVDTIIAGTQALAQKFETEVLGPVGGREAYDSMVEWAKTNLTPAQIATHNKLVAASQEEAQLAVAALHQKFVAANGNNPDLLKGGSHGASGEGSFQSVAEHKAAIRDPRYKNDPAYRASVEAKLTRSTLYGV